MNYYFTLLLFLVTSFSLVAQEVMTIAATVLDEQTKEPVSFVNVGFPEKGIGTVTNEYGNFSLTLNNKDIGEDTVLQISSLGYKTKNLPIHSLGALTSNKALVYLTPTQYALDEVVLTSEKREFDRLGSYTYSKENLGYWMNKEGLGGEIATRITVNKKNTQLQNLTFNIVENKGDSLLVRVKVYDYHRGFPGKNLVTQNIFHTITRKKGVETIPLKEYNIIAHEDVIVSLELVKVYGSYIYFSLSSTPYGGLAYTKERSMDSWKSYRGTGIAFGLIASYPSESAEKDIVSRSKPRNIDLYWDASLPAKNRNVDEELKLLGKYINHLGDATIRVVTFSHGLSVEEMFNIKNGRSKDLEEYLENTYYNGATDFSDVLKRNLNSANVALVFTNGRSILAPLKPTVTIPIFCINSLDRAADANLQEISYASGGHYINLSRIKVKDGLAYLTKDIEDKSAYSKDQQVDTSDYLYGVVFNENDIPLQGATVQIKGSFTQVETDANGTYAIDAVPEDILIIKAFGMHRKDVLVGLSKKLNIQLKTKNELLDEVFLETKVADSGREKKIDSLFATNKRRGIDILLHNSITSEEISPDKVELHQVLNEQNGVIAVQNGLGNTYSYVLRRTLSNPGHDAARAAIVIDGVIYDPTSNVVLFLDPQTIDNIIILQPGMSTVRYGPVAAFGAIVIETKSYSASKNKKIEEENTSSILATGNDYNEDLFTLEMVKNKKQSPKYIHNLEESATMEEAKMRYQKLQRVYGNTIPFYLQTANYFETWDTSFADAVRSNIITLALDNVKALKALAFAYEEKGALQKANYLYKRIINIVPENLQSYLDVARISEALGDIKTAETLYTQLLYNTIPNVNAEEAQEQVINEFRKLVANHKSQINFDELPEEFLKVGFKQDVRIVFDWNDPTAEFELQFVSPENKYYKFSHTSFENKTYMEQGVKDGLLSKEFILDNGEKGRWLINVNHLGEVEQENPTYLKYTLYQNYGLPNETKEIKVINLSDYNQKVTLDSFTL
tara:strand:+ start:16354 stop:19401 length:3048 start_codon:yes stop_codon:yes gene_type:complete